MIVSFWTIKYTSSFFFFIVFAISKFSKTKNFGFPESPFLANQSSAIFKSFYDF